MNHTHGETVDSVSRRTTIFLQGFAAVLALVTVMGIVVLRPQGELRVARNALGFSTKVYPGHVMLIIEQPCSGTNPKAGVMCTMARVRLKAGPDSGQIISLENPESPTSPNIKPGDDIVLNYIPKEPLDFRYAYADQQRRGPLFLLAIVFALFVVVFGRLRGLAAVIGLVASIVVILTFILPAILDGRSPFLVSVVGSSAIAFLVLYLAHGFKPITAVALIGTLISLGFILFFGSVFVGLSHFSGLASEDAVFLKVIAGKIDLTGLILAGMVIAALGALNDMTVTQTSAVFELHAANPELGERKLRKSATKIGRDHIAATVNTLAMAYAGSALPLLILFVLSGQSLGTVANGEVVATEIVGALVGSIGLVVAVPITTFLAARVAIVDYETQGPRLPD